MLNASLLPAANTPQHALAVYDALVALGDNTPAWSWRACAARLERAANAVPATFADRYTSRAADCLARAARLDAAARVTADIHALQQHAIAIGDARLLYLTRQAQTGSPPDRTIAIQGCRDQLEMMLLTGESLRTPAVLEPVVDRSPVGHWPRLALQAALLLTLLVAIPTV